MTIPECNTRTFSWKFWSAGSWELKITQTLLNRSARWCRLKISTKTLELLILVGTLSLTNFADKLPRKHSCPQNWHSFGNSCYLQVQAKKTQEDAAVSCANYKKIAIRFNIFLIVSKCHLLYWVPQYRRSLIEMVWVLHFSNLGEGCGLHLNKSNFPSPYLARMVSA